MSDRGNYADLAALVIFPQNSLLELKTSSKDSTRCKKVKFVSFMVLSCINWAGHKIIPTHSLTLWAFFRKVYLLYVVRVKAAPQSKKFFCHYTGRLQLKYSFHVSQRWYPLINFVLGVGFSHGWLDSPALLNPVWSPARPFPVLPKWL